MARLAIHHTKSVIYIISLDVIREPVIITANYKTGYILSKVPLSIYTLSKTDMLGYTS